MGFFDSIKGLFGGGAEPQKSPEELALLRTISERPDDMAVRLEYARLLEAKQNPLGTYIRCEVEKIGLPEEDERFQSLTAEADDLIDQHGKRWVRPFKELELEPTLVGTYLPSLWYARGMVEELTIDKRGAIPGKMDRILELAPALRKLVFARCSPDWKAIAAAPQMRRIRAMELAEVKPTLDDVRLLAASPHLASIEELDLSDKSHGPELALAVAESPAWTQLKVLKLSSCRLGIEGVKHLAAAKNLGGLEELDLSYNDLDTEAVAVLAASPNFAKLKRLSLHGNDLSSAAGAILAGGTFRQLEELDVGSTKLGVEGVTALATAGIFGALSKLDVGYNDCHDAGLIAWTKSPHLGSVRVLNFAGNELTDAAIIALAGSPKVRKVVELDLSSNGFGSATALVRSSHLNKLKALKLFSVPLTEEDFVALRQRYGTDAVQK